LKSLKQSQQQLTLHRLALHQREYPDLMLQVIEIGGPPSNEQHHVRSSKPSDARVSFKMPLEEPPPKTVPTSSMKKEKSPRSPQFLPKIKHRNKPISRPEVCSEEEQNPDQVTCNGNSFRNNAEDRERATLLPSKMRVPGIRSSLEDETTTELQKPLFAAAFIEHPSLSKTENWRGFCLHKLQMIRLGLKSPISWSSSQYSFAQSWRIQRKAIKLIQKAYRRYRQRQTQKHREFLRVQEEERQALIIWKVEQDARKLAQRESDDMSILMNTRMFNIKHESEAQNRVNQSKNVRANECENKIQHFFVPLSHSKILSRPHISATRIQICWRKFKVLKNQRIFQNGLFDSSSNQTSAAAFLIASHSKAKAATVSDGEKGQKSNYVPGTFLHRRRNQCAAIIQRIVRVWLAHLYVLNIKLDLRRQQQGAKEKKAATAIQTRMRANMARGGTRRKKHVNAMEEKRKKEMDKAAKRLQNFSRTKQAKVKHVAD
jgi:hypothetical protein